jgi:hypothetical protein
MDIDQTGNAATNKEYDVVEHWKNLQKERQDKEAIALCSIFSPDGNYLITGTNYGFINIWSVPSVLVRSI